jgi:hypothetical protein
MGLRITTDHTTAGTQGFAVHSADAQATYSNEDTNKNSGLNLVVGTIYYGFGNLTNYMVNSTTPWSSSTNFLGNTTNTFYNVTGLNWGTDYSFSASVLTEGGTTLLVVC